MMMMMMICLFADLVLDIATTFSDIGSLEMRPFSTPPTPSTRSRATTEQVSSIRTTTAVSSPFSLWACVFQRTVGTEPSQGKIGYPALFKMAGRVGMTILGSI
jgi:hypothetical protein